MPPSFFDENICTAQNFDECTIFNPSLFVSSISVQFFLDFHSSPSIGRLRVTPVSFVKTTESHMVCRLGHHLDTTLTGTDRNRRAYLPHRTRLCGPCIAAIAGYKSVQIYGVNLYALRCFKKGNSFETSCLFA